MTEASTSPRTHRAMRAESDRRIVGAAIAAFAERGYHRTTLAQVGEAAGFTGALISRRYGSKAGLAREVFVHIRRRLTPMGSEGGAELGGDRWVDTDRSARAQLDGFVHSYVRDAVEQPTRLRALYVLLGEALGGMDELDEQVALVNRVFRDHIAGYVRLGQRQREFRADVDADQSAVVIVGVLRGVVTQVLAEPNEHDVDALTVELQRTVLLPLLRQIDTDTSLPDDDDD
ncbi:MAG: TetR/AcrR family transcriptional regulator [Actinomycetota bacterium]